MKPLLYVAGPYRDQRGEWFVRHNIRAAEAVTVELWRMGAAVICPHKNTAGFTGVCPDDYWLEGDLAMMAVCRGSVFLPTWRESSGARSEHEFGARLPGHHLFYWPQDRELIENHICRWLRESHPATG